MERRFVTCLFADLVGSTSFVEAHDPEVAHATISSTLKTAARAIEFHGGMVHQVMGDGLLAVFGFPRTHEDDPERAVRAGLAMQGALSELSPENADDPASQLELRVGIESGELLVTGDVERGDLKFTGDAINLAARMQNLADPGSVVVGPSAYDATRSSIDYTPLGEFELKGKAQAVPAWKAGGPNQLREEGAWFVPSRLSLAGRAAELNEMDATFEDAVTTGTPAIIEVVGEAGVGKSRLVWEFTSQVEDRIGASIFRGRCLDYGDVSYSALAGAMKERFGILRDDSTEVIAEKVRTVVLDVMNEEALVEHLCVLVGGRVDREITQDELFDAWLRFLVESSMQHPVLLVFEDLHWADEGLLDFIGYLQAWGAGRLVIVMTARPGGPRIGLQHGDRVTKIDLEPLGAKESALLVSELVGGDVSNDALQVIVSRAGGNPLFVEELTRMFLESDFLMHQDGEWILATLPHDHVIPRTIQGLIAARLDQLGSEERSIVRDASVIGRLFLPAALVELSASPDHVGESLGTLATKGLVAPRGPGAVASVTEWAFHHVLIRDVAYASLSKAERAMKHLEVADWLERYAEGDSAESIEVIADHLLRGVGYRLDLRQSVERDLGARAFAAAVSAGERSAHLWQLQRAAEWYERALSIAPAGVEDRSRVASVWERYGRLLHDTSSPEQARRAFETALDIYESMGEERASGAVRTELAWTVFELGNEEEAIAIAERAVSDLKPLGDSSELVWALRAVGRCHLRMGRLQEGRGLLDSGLAVARRIGDLHAEAACLQALMIVFAHVNDPEERRRTAERALRLAEETHDVRLLIISYNNMASDLWFSDLAAADEMDKKALQLAIDTGSREMEAWVNASTAFSKWYQGKLDIAMEHASRALAIARRGGWKPTLAHALNAMVFVMRLQGRWEEAAPHRQELDDYIARVPQHDIVTVAKLGDAYVAHARGENVVAVEILSRCLEDCGVPQGAQQEVTEELLFELIRELVLLGRRDEATRWYSILSAFPETQPDAAAFLIWARGLMAEDHNEALEALDRARRLWAARPRAIQVARCWVDRARIKVAAGLPAGDDLERARAALLQTGAHLWLCDIDRIRQRLSAI